MKNSEKESTKSKRPDVGIGLLIPEPLWGKLKDRAKRNRSSLRKVIIDSLEDSVAKPKKDVPA